MWPGVEFMGSANPLLGRSVLIVEDEPLIALELNGALHAAGASTLAATTINEALELIAYAQICAAIVDVNLGGRDCSSVCTALAKRSIPFIFYTGYSCAAALSAWPHAPAVEKPADDSMIVDALVHLLPSGDATQIADLTILQP
jgi:CheY-like chemotaxis protein